MPPLFEETGCQAITVESVMGRGPTHYCWRCYAANPVPAGRCTECGGAIEQPAGVTYSEQLIWALGHRLAGTQMIAAEVLGELREPAAEGPLRTLVADGDPYLAARALQSLVSIVGVSGARDLLEPLAESGAPAIRRVALHALNYGR
jgi:HEAT repeats